ncbi:MAG: hypothetical protein KA052_02835 [Candidatus Pacebacteria bacterium]|nr:hypothetical protein [Candidatus Paceibacterota bacterium]
MKQRPGLFALLAGVLLLSQASIAYASSHGAAPAELSFIGMVLWEIEHFMIHMNLTWQALLMVPSSPQFGWALLGDQTLCASMSPLVGVLFGSAWSALATFALTILAMLSIMIWAVLRIRHMLVMHRPQWHMAPHAIA